MRHPILLLYQAHCGGRTQSRLWPLLGIFLFAALLGVAHGAAAQPPDISGTWTDSGGTIWVLKASGPGLRSLHASWQGAPGPHSGLRGTFEGTLSPQGGNYAYTGTISITEGSGHVTGTMTFVIVGPDKISMSYQQSNGPRGQNIIFWRGGCQGCQILTGPVQIDISFQADSLPTNPPLDGGGCPGPTPAIVTGSFQARIMETDLSHQGGGTVTDTPHLAKCRVPRISINVDHITVARQPTTNRSVAFGDTPGYILQATMQVHITDEAVHKPGDCLQNATGVIVATYNDTLIVSNGYQNDRLEIGPWTTTPCSAHTHVITNTISSIPAGGSGSTWVRVYVRCLGGPGKIGGTGYSPRNCGT